MKKPKVIVICGPTASGKTKLSIELAKTIDGEIVSCDSMQIYKDMNIGTAKVTKEEAQGVKHYLVDFISPDQRYSVANYKKDATNAIEEILKKGKVPIVVGGTGLYVDSLIYNIDYAETQKDIKEVSIIPRGVAGGYTMYKTNEDKYYISKTEMEEKLVSLLGGRAAEQIALNDISTGASNDIEVATQIAKSMITKYGMSKTLGPIYIDTDKDPYELQLLGEKFGDAIGAEVKIMIDTAYARAQEILRNNMPKLDKVAEKLLEKEIISADEFQELIQ